MHSKIFYAGAFALLAQLVPAAAQPALPGPAPRAIGAGSAPAGTFLTHEQAIDQALAANALLRASAFALPIADALRQQAGALPNPELAFVREGGPPGTRTRSFQLSQPVELGGKRAARIALAERERSLAGSDLALAVADLKVAVSHAYFNALIAQERVSLAQTTLALAARAAAAASKRVAAGRVSPLEEDRASLTEAAARLDLAQAQDELTLARQALAAMWGALEADLPALAAPPPSMAPLPPLAQLRQQLADAPALRRARQQLAREEAQVRVERSLRVPDLTLTVGNKRDEALGRAQTVLGVSAPLPLFNRNDGKLQAALARAEQARALIEAEQLRLEQDLSSTYQRAERTKEQLRSMQEEILPAAQRVFDATVRGFEAGKFSFLDVIDAQRTLLQSRTRSLETMHARYRSVAELGRYLAPDAGLHHRDRNGLLP